MNALAALELRLLIQDKVEKALLLISDALPRCGKLSDEVYDKLMEARDQIHSATVLCRMQGEGATPKVVVTEADSDKAAE